MDDPVWNGDADGSNKNFNGLLEICELINLVGSTEELRTFIFGAVSCGTYLRATGQHH